MNKYELWIMVVGGESDDERCIYTGNSHSELDQAILSAEDEVTQDPDKYFELITPDNNYTFYDYDDFSKLGEEKNNIKHLVNKILEGADVHSVLLGIVEESAQSPTVIQLKSKQDAYSYIDDNNIRYEKIDDLGDNIVWWYPFNSGALRVNKKAAHYDVKNQKLYIY